MLLELTSRVERKVAGSTVILTFEDNWSVCIINQFASSKYLLVKLTWRRPVLRKFVSLLWRERGCSGDNCFWLYFSFGFSKWNWSCSFRHNCHNALLRKRCCTKSRWFFVTKTFRLTLFWISVKSPFSTPPMLLFIFAWGRHWSFWNHITQAFSDIFINASLRRQKPTSLNEKASL